MNVFRKRYTKPGQVSRISKAADTPISQQLQKTDNTINHEGLVEWPYSPNSFWKLWEHNPIYNRCTRQIAIDTVGHGYRLEPREPGTQMRNTELERVKALLRHPSLQRGPKGSFRRVMHSAILDGGAIGNYAFELRVNNKGDLEGFEHMRPHQFRWHKDRNRICQTIGSNKKWFRAYGAAGNISSKTGEEYIGLGAEKANDVVWIDNYYWDSTFYGVPNILPGVRTVLSQIGIGDFNLSTFINYAVPAMIIELEGTWDENVPSEITSFFDEEIKGSENAHKTLVVEVPEDGKFTHKEIAMLKEGSFKDLNDGLTREALICYAMPPYRIGLPIMGTLGGNIAEELIEVYNSGVVEPNQEDIEDFINETVIAEGLKVDSVVMKLNDLDIRNETERVRRWCELIEHGIINPDAARSDLGLPPREDGKGGQYLIGTHLMMLDKWMKQQDAVMERLEGYGYASGRY